MPKRTTRKPAKPYDGFPLFAHATKRWAKKIRGKLYYFGPWADPLGALAKYCDLRDDLHAGRTPRAPADGIALRELANRFLTTKQNLVDSGEITARTFADYHATCARVLRHFGKTRLVADLAAEDFERLRASIAKAWGPVRLGNEVQRVRTLFKYAYDQGLIDRPIRYGQTFQKPSRAVLRKARHARGERMFEADELRRILDAAPRPLRTMILLGINCGFGNSDVASLPVAALDLKTGWVNYPRPKTGIPRRCPLWPETVEALREAVKSRPLTRAEASKNLVFITKYGNAWGKTIPDSPVSNEMGKLLRSLGIRRKYVNFYSLRHTFETIGGAARDQVAVNSIMGHAPSERDMSAIYRERIEDERLKAVTDYVRNWLFAPTAQEDTKEIAKG